MGGTYDGPHEDDLKVPDLVDAAQVASLREVYGDDLAAAMAGFLAQLDARVVALVDATTPAGTADLAGRLHLLAGSCSTVGATAVAQRCREVEELLCAGRTNEAMTVLRRLPDLWRRSASELAAASR